MESKARYNEPEKSFDLFLKDLRQQEDKAWLWLLDHFREKVVPYIRKKDGRLPKDAIIAEPYFIEEIFANSLIKFYELFDKGEFENLGQLRSLMFRIAELKLKEAYKQVQKDKVLFFSTPPSSAGNKQIENDTISLEQEQQEVVQNLEQALEALPDIDRELLLRFSRGERLKKIASDLSINETNCRKKKQRALAKLRQLLTPLLSKQGL